MVINKQIDESKHLTTFSMAGEAAFEDIIAALKSLYEGTPTRNVFWDCSDGSLTNITTEQIEKLASFSPRFGKARKGGKTAIYSPGDMAFGLSRMFEILGKLRNVPIQTKVFRNKDEARQWLEEG